MSMLQEMVERNIILSIDLLVDIIEFNESH